MGFFTEMMWLHNRGAEEARGQWWRKSACVRWKCTWGAQGKLDAPEERDGAAHRFEGVGRTLAACLASELLPRLARLQRQRGIVEDEGHLSTDFLFGKRLSAAGMSS